MGLNIDIELENGQWRGTLQMNACEAAKQFQPEILRFLASELKKNTSLHISTMDFGYAKIRIYGVWNSMTECSIITTKIEHSSGIKN